MTFRTNAKMSRMKPPQLEEGKHTRNIKLFTEIEKIDKLCRANLKGITETSI